jgi:hypothetical protein
MTTKERAKLRNIVGRLQVILEDLKALQKMPVINKKRLCHEHFRRRPPERQPLFQSVNSLGTPVRRLPFPTLPSPTLAVFARRSL